MSTLPSPPFVHVEGIANFRDIGGYACADSQHEVRKGVIFRAADPTKATPAGLKKMQELGIKTIFDLRSEPEIKRDGPEWAGVDVDHPDPFKDYGIERVWVPVFAEKDYSPDQIALRYKEYTRSGFEVGDMERLERRWADMWSKGFVKAYSDILKSGKSAYTTIFQHLAQSSPSPCLIHCTAGKDRTGILTALIFLLAGVNPETISEEYSLTDLGLAEMKPIFIERLLKNPALEGNRDGVTNMISSKRENMHASIEMVQEEFGGAETYVREHCGLGDEEVATLKKNLVEQKSS